MTGGLAMLDFITEANDFDYSQVQYAIKLVRKSTENNHIIADWLCYLETIGSIFTDKGFYR